MGLGLCSVFQGHTYVLVEVVWDTFCISSESKSSCPLSVRCSVDRRVFTPSNPACYKVEEEEVAENWKMEIRPLPRFLFLGQLQSWAFYRGGTAVTDVCRKRIWSMELVGAFRERKLYQVTWAEHDPFLHTVGSAACTKQVQTAMLAFLRTACSVSFEHGPECPCSKMALRMTAKRRGEVVFHVTAVPVIYIYLMNLLRCSFFEEKPFIIISITTGWKEILHCHCSWCRELWSANFGLAAVPTTDFHINFSDLAGIPLFWF